MNTTCHHVFMKKERHHIILPRPEYIARAPQGGGAIFAPSPLVFCDDSRSYVRIIAKFSIPSKPSNWHILTKRKLARFDRSAINDVRVTSCFPVFRQK